LHRDARPLALRADAAIENRRNLEFLTNDARILSFALELERGYSSATRSPEVLASPLRSSSAMLSQRYSWFLSGLISVNGSTAMDG